MKPRDHRSINMKGMKCAQQQFVGKHESLTCYLHMQGMLNNNTTSYTVYARAVTINYPYMTIFTFHNLGGESFILFTNQIISLCTSKHFFSLSLSLFFFFFHCLCQPCLLLCNSVISFFLAEFATFHFLYHYFVVHITRIRQPDEKSTFTLLLRPFLPPADGYLQPFALCSSHHLHTLGENLRSVVPSQICNVAVPYLRLTYILQQWIVILYEFAFYLISHNISWEVK